MIFNVLNKDSLRSTLPFLPAKDQLNLLTAKSLDAAMRTDTLKQSIATSYSASPLVFNSHSNTISVDSSGQLISLQDFSSQKIHLQCPLNWSTDISNLQWKKLYLLLKTGKSFISRLDIFSTTAEKPSELGDRVKDIVAISPFIQEIHVESLDIASKLLSQHLNGTSLKIFFNSTSVLTKEAIPKPLQALGFNHLASLTLSGIYYYTLSKS